MTPVAASRAASEGQPSSRHVVAFFTARNHPERQPGDELQAVGAGPPDTGEASNPPGARAHPSS